MCVRRGRRDDAPGLRGPDAHGRVQRAGRDSVAIEGYGVDLVVVPPEDLQALARVDVPELSAIQAISTPLGAGSSSKGRRLTRQEQS